MNIILDVGIIRHSRNNHIIRVVVRISVITEREFDFLLPRPHHFGSRFQLKPNKKQSESGHGEERKHCLLTFMLSTTQPPSTPRMYSKNLSLRNTDPQKAPTHQIKLKYFGGGYDSLPLPGTLSSSLRGFKSVTL